MDSIMFDDSLLDLDKECPECLEKSLTVEVFTKKPVEVNKIVCTNCEYSYLIEGEDDFFDDKMRNKKVKKSKFDDY